MYDKTPYFYGTGRRKSSVARVRLYQGTGKITINDRDIDDYLFEYLYDHKEEHNWDYDKMKSFMKENLKDWKTEYDLKAHVSMESIDKYLQRYCNKK